MALMVPILTIIDIYAAYLHREVLHWSTVWILLPPSFGGMALGAVVDGYLTDKGARRVLLFRFSLRSLTYIFFIFLCVLHLSLSNISQPSKGFWLGQS